VPVFGAEVEERRAFDGRLRGELGFELPVSEIKVEEVATAQDALEFETRNKVGVASLVPNFLHELGREVVERYGDLRNGCVGEHLVHEQCVKEIILELVTVPKTCLVEEALASGEDFVASNAKGAPLRVLEWVALEDVEVTVDFLF
jgi:hypothetical protein